MLMRFNEFQFGGNINMQSVTLLSTNHLLTFPKQDHYTYTKPYWLCNS